MTNPISRFFARRRGIEAFDFEQRVSDIRDDFSHPTYFRGDPCAGCGGYFQSEFLKAAYRIKVTFRADGTTVTPYVEEASYCQTCAPPGAFQLILRDHKKEELDALSFQVKEGWLQVVDKRTGEDQYLVSMEEYSHLYCECCGELSAWTKCAACTRKAREKAASPTGEVRKA